MKKTKTLNDSLKIVKFYEATREWYKHCELQLSLDWAEEMERRPKVHHIDQPEYCLSVLWLMFNNTNKPSDKPFTEEARNLLSYYQNNFKTIKKTWDKKCDMTLFEWTLTSYDRYKADMRGPLSLSTIFNKN
jgi:hypothetical protein